MSATVIPEQLIKALTAVIPHASTDRMLPALRAVRLEAADGEATLIATQRYTMATHTFDWAGDPVETLLELDTAKELLRFAKTIKGREATQPSITLDFVSEKTVDVAGPTQRMTLPLHTDVDFPRWRAVMPDGGQHDGFPVIGFTPALLALFAKSAEKGEVMRMVFGAGPVKIVRVEIGDRFVGAIMPTRLPDTNA